MAQYVFSFNLSKSFFQPVLDFFFTGLPPSGFFFFLFIYVLHVYIRLNCDRFTLRTISK